jgi:chromosome segregation protein
VRLKQLRLAGFKSFVDPTHFEVPGQLVGVVGPNGCGKSNIMDAVRWVLGESKASELRGESMTDVIFSGTTERKAGSRASVELIFDNSLGRIGGSWAEFAEISVKRVLTRDGNSTYYINNQTVRRRDVHDMFLGTGLGPRAYAIIGQGMISRIIEAKPEELRVFLEEAAGISKYKERRRETENRLSDTRENLTRVDDILRELNAQIDKLERQAEVAREYRDLEADRLRKQQTLWMVRRDEAKHEQGRVLELAAAAVTALESKVAELRHLETELETVRAQHYEAGDAVHELQASFYESNALVSKIESEIRLSSETSRQLAERLDILSNQLLQAQTLQTEGSSQLEQMREEQEAALIFAEEAQGRLADTETITPQFEEAVQKSRAQLDEQRTKVAEAQRQFDLCSLQQRSTQEGIEKARSRSERLKSEAAQLSHFDADTLAVAVEALAIAEDSEQASMQASQTSEQQWQAAERERGPAVESLRQTEAQSAKVEARLAALKQLQERLQSQAKLNPWLARHGLDSMKRMWQKLRIEEGWEKAIESVLREKVQAIEVGRLDLASGFAMDPPPAKVGFFSAEGHQGTNRAETSAAWLSHKLQTEDVRLKQILADFLAGAMACATLDQAIKQRGDLPQGAFFVTPEGHQVSNGFVHLYAADSEQEGVLQRQHELENLQIEAKQLASQLEQARAHAARIESDVRSKQSQSALTRDAHTAQMRLLATARMEAQRLQQEKARFDADHSRLSAEQSESASALVDLEANLEELAARFDELDLAIAQEQEVLEALRVQLEEAELKLQNHREMLRSHDREHQESGFKQRSLVMNIERLQSNISNALQMATQAALEQSTVRQRLSEISQGDHQVALQEALEARTHREADLTAGRNRLDALVQQMRQSDELRQRLEREQEPMRARMTDLQLKEQAARINFDQFHLQLSEAQVDEEVENTLRASFVELPKASWLQGEVTRLTNAVAGLGPVNLAALDELAQSQERKVFLDSQMADLTEAIETLEDAIRKIDKETRDLLQATYDTVNKNFGQLFPELFGGGEARLVMTGDEILDAGIQVVAQPPGKRNTSIHLLSGGEKALTAIALVFSLFQLNPAPFCLLDEVDAPLDDSNTERYCDMVRRMSAQTQFLFITHNKIAMELATQLVGVTMQERGVSRIVAVDLDAASQMLEAA